MESICSLLLVLFINATSVAQPTKSYDKVYTVQMDVVLVLGLPVAIHMEQMGTAKENGIVRCYKDPNARVKQALSFKTNKDLPKLA